MKEKELSRVADSSQYFQMVSSEKKSITLTKYNVGDTIVLGNYPQTEAGERLPVEWIILDIYFKNQGGKQAVLISKNCLMQSYFAEYESVVKNGREYGKWESSLARKVCNEFFLEAAFSAVEKDLLLEKTVGTFYNVGLGVKDKVFLLSEHEVAKYMPNPSDRLANATGYVNKGDILKNNQDHASWWILPKKDEYIEEYYPQAVWPDGEIQYHSRNIYHGDFTIRPSIFIDLDRYDEYKRSQSTFEKSEPRREMVHEAKIGRSPHCRIVLKDKTVSREHACIYFDGEDNWYIRDMGSRNGIKINSVQVGYSRLNVGDVVQIGESFIEYNGGCFDITEANEKTRFWIPEKYKLKNAMQKEKKERYLGCLLGGAVGDALGYPIEFSQEKSIFTFYGNEGIQTLAQAGNPAVISDDTQMTLFAANGLIYNISLHNMPPGAPTWYAYQEWLATQGDYSCMSSEAKPKMWIFQDERLHALRAPGTTCMSALRNMAGKTEVVYAQNNSKGCGTVMRAAPFGLAESYNPKYSRGDSGYTVYKLAKTDALLTHGHEMAWRASVALADIVFKLVQYHPQRDCKLEELLLGIEDYTGGIKKAVQLALDKEVTDLDGIHSLGEGWVAEEALHIAVFCAVRYQNDFAKAIRTAVNHNGDSDSTGAICGNILGAWLGKGAVEQAFDLSNLELADIIEEIAEDLYRAVEVGIPHVGIDKDWDRKYFD